MTLYRFYRIVGSGADSDEYIGSTKQPLHKRFYEHKANYRRGTPDTKSCMIFLKYGVENCSIVLIHELECETKQHALREERRIYDERNAMRNVVNAYRPSITPEEEKETTNAYNKEYYGVHKSEWKERYGNQAKEHYKANREKYLQKVKEYRKANKEKISERNKLKYKQLTEEQREENNRKRRERRKQKKLTLDA